jgi:transaldolase
MQDSITRARKTANVEIIWTSTREVFNVIEADERVPYYYDAADILKKLTALGSKTARNFRATLSSVSPRTPWPPV